MRTAVGARVVEVAGAVIIAYALGISRISGIAHAGECARACGRAVGGERTAHGFVPHTGINRHAERGIARAVVITGLAHADRDKRAKVHRVVAERIGSARYVGGKTGVYEVTVLKAA